MNALALVTRGMVSQSSAVAQACATAEELARPVSVKPVIHAVSTAHITLRKKEPVPEQPKIAAKPKATISAKFVEGPSVKVSVKDTAPAPAPSSPSTSEAPSKPTLTVKKNGNGHKPRLQVKKKT